MAEPDRTNADAERVSDIQKPVAWRCFDEGSWMVDTERHTDWEPLYTADIIEAQSKALAEAREAGTVLLELLDDYMTVSSITANDRYRAALEAFRTSITPTPENPNG